MGEELRMKEPNIKHPIRKEDPMHKKQAEELLVKVVFELANWLIERWKNRKTEVKNDGENEGGKKDRKNRQRSRS
jgi:hypothetical protein